MPTCRRLVLQIQAEELECQLYPLEEGQCQVFLAVVSRKCCLAMSGGLSCESVLTKEETCGFEEEGVG